MSSAGKPKVKKAAEKGEKVGRGGSKEKEAILPPNYPDIAVCNAAGALHHLTFMDKCKYQIWGKRVKEGLGWGEGSLIQWRAFWVDGRRAVAKQGPDMLK